jgi:hypothetical protein
LPSQLWVFCFSGIALFAASEENERNIMKYQKNKLAARFRAETRFAVTPTAAVPFRGTQETALDRLKGRLLQQLLTETTDADYYAPLRRAANDAASLAWLTPYPLLFFPALLEEKAQTARRQETKQKQVRRRSPRLLSEAA